MTGFILFICIDVLISFLWSFYIPMCGCLCIGCLPPTGQITIEDAAQNIYRKIEWEQKRNPLLLWLCEAEKKSNIYLRCVCSLWLCPVGHGVKLGERKSERRCPPAIHYTRTMVKTVCFFCFFILSLAHTLSGRKSHKTTTYHWIGFDPAAHHTHTQKLCGYKNAAYHIMPMRCVML